MKDQEPALTSPAPFLNGSGLDPVRSHPHRPTPNPATGELQVDPEISLRAKGMTLQVEFYYLSGSTIDGPYGVARSASVNGCVYSQVSAGAIGLRRGDGHEFYYDSTGSAGGVTSYAPMAGFYSPNTVVYDGTTFTETYPDGTQLLYQAQTASATSPIPQEPVVAITPQGLRTTYSYGTGDEAGLLKAIQEPAGRLLTFAYGPSTGPVSLLSSVTDWGGRVTTLQYDASRNLTTLVQPSGCTTKYSYALAPSGNLRMSVIEDPRGYRTSYSYDAQDRVASMAMGSAVWTWTYAGAIDGSQVVSPSGGITTYLLDASGRIS